ncbi:hypothetical protein HYE82_13020 [Streptomyces sp. BR123]|uniref:hypothetical protein n=1 Tax=Streptomyces sp. BR123 TaxID=2749828 RepID=UPI0015C4BAEE|nr:hypothetical protein [Streptomyces sp. BR123]NXY95291.1 hypothetical protein [Streptomyces sp. BR123]
MTLVTVLILVAVLGCIALLALAPAAPVGGNPDPGRPAADPAGLKTVPGQRGVHHHRAG